MSEGTASPSPSRAPLFCRIQPHYVLAAPSEAPWLFGRMGDTYTTALLLVHGGTLRRDTGNTITHAARQAATRYRKAEIDNAGGPPAPYPNLDTRPAPAPGSSRQDPVLPSVSTIFADLYASLHPFPLTRLYFEFRREKLWFVGFLIRILSSLIFLLRSLKDKNCCDLYPFLHRFPLTRLYFVGI